MLRLKLSYCHCFEGKATIMACCIRAEIQIMFSNPKGGGVNVSSLLLSLNYQIHPYLPGKLHSHCICQEINPAEYMCMYSDHMSICNATTTNKWNHAHISWDILLNESIWVFFLWNRHDSDEIRHIFKGTKKAFYCNESKITELEMNDTKLLYCMCNDV